MIKERASLISIAPWFIVTLIFLLFGAEGNSIGKLCALSMVLHGSFIGTYLVLEKFKSFNLYGYFSCGIIMALIYYMLSWSVGNGTEASLFAAFIGVSSYLLFVFLVDKNVPKPKDQV